MHFRKAYLLVCALCAATHCAPSTATSDPNAFWASLTMSPTPITTTAGSTPAPTDAPAAPSSETPTPLITPIASAANGPELTNAPTPVPTPGPTSAPSATPSTDGGPMSAVRDPNADFGPATGGGARPTWPTSAPTTVTPAPALETPAPAAPVLATETAAPTTSAPETLVSVVETPTRIVAPGSESTAPIDEPLASDTTDTGSSVEIESPTEVPDIDAPASSLSGSFDASSDDELTSAAHPAPLLVDSPTLVPTVNAPTPAPQGLSAPTTVTRTAPNGSLTSTVIFSGDNISTPHA